MPTPLSRRQLARRLVLGAAGTCGLAGIVIEYGTYPEGILPGMALGLSAAAVLFFAAELVLAGREARSFRTFLRARWPHLTLLVLLLVEGLAVLAGRRAFGPSGTFGRLITGDLTRTYLVLVQIYIVAILAVELPHLHGRFARWRIRPAVSIVLVYAVLIAAGAGLLLLPRATPPAAPIAPLDAVFTATSAVCVTGLIVRDTGADFTVFGQTVIIALIQLGGLGIMSLTAALGLLLGRGIGVRESSLLREVFQLPMMAEVGRTVRGIIVTTLAIEAIGTAVLYQGLGGVIADPGGRLGVAAFHAISAFCNAGFSTFDDSLVGLAGRPFFVQGVAGLIVLGGLGFGVLAQVGAWLRGRMLRQSPRPRFGLHERVVLALTGGLIVGGAALILALEGQGALAGEPVWLRISNALFQSVTCRTAGFATLELTRLAPATLFLMIGLMTIGGAPGSTAGGMKITTMAIAWANLRAIGSGVGAVRLGRREIDPVLVQRAMLVVSVGVVVVAAAIFALLITERQPLLETTFEAVSALGTVGLSLGLTPLLSPVGRIVVILLMFIGRLGPLTVASSLTGPGRDPRVRLPRGRLMVG